MYLSRCRLSIIRAILITGGDKQDATTRLLKGAQVPAEDITADMLLETPAIGARVQKQTLIFATEESLA